MRIELRARPADVMTGQYPLKASLQSLPGPGALDADVHECFEVSIVLAGEYDRHYADLVVIQKPGDVSLTAAWEPHGWQMLAPETPSVVIQFFPEALGDERIRGRHWLSLFALRPADRPQASTRETRQRVLEIARDMAVEIRQQKTEWLTAVRLGLLRVLLTLARDWDWPARHDRVPSVHRHDLARIMPALRMVESHLNRRVSREEAARTCALSIRQFSHIFRHVMGLSFGEFALRARLASAAHHLLYTDLSIEAIASETGFVDGAHLHRMFEKQFGQTPAQYRREGRRPALPRRTSSGAGEL